MSRSDQTSVSTFKPFDDQFRRRPLPPIPQELESYTQPVRNNGGSWFRKYGGQSQRSSPRWNSRVSVTKSRPIPRTGSEPNLLDEELGTTGKLSSAISLECLNIESSQKEKYGSKSIQENAEKTTFLSLPRRVRPKPDSSALLTNQQPRFPSDQSESRSIVTKVLTQYPDARTVSALDGKVSTAGLPLRPPPPQRPSAEEIVYSFRAKSKRKSLIRRERPVSPGMKRRSGTYNTSPEIAEEPAISVTTAGYKDSSMVRLFKSVHERSLCGGLFSALATLNFAELFSN